MRHSLYEDTDGVIHACDFGRIHPGTMLVWTLCDKDVPANKSYVSTAEPPEEPTCEGCLANPQPTKQEE